MTHVGGVPLTRDKLVFGGTNVHPYSEVRVTRVTYENKDGKNKPDRKPSQVGASQDAAFRGYINLTLTTAEKEGFELWSTSDTLWDTLQEQVDGGVNVSLKSDPKSGGFLASATQRNPSSPNAGLVVTARADGAGKALCRVVYCLHILSQAERWEDRQPLADPDRW